MCFGGPRCCACARDRPSSVEDGLGDPIYVRREDVWRSAGNHRPVFIPFSPAYRAERRPDRPDRPGGGRWARRRRPVAVRSPRGLTELFSKCPLQLRSNGKAAEEFPLRSSDLVPQFGSVNGNLSDAPELMASKLSLTGGRRRASCPPLMSSKPPSS